MLFSVSVHFFLLSRRALSIMYIRVSIYYYHCIYLGFGIWDLRKRNDISMRIRHR